MCITGSSHYSHKAWLDFYPYLLLPVRRGSSMPAFQPFFCLCFIHMYAARLVIRLRCALIVSLVSKSGRRRAKMASDVMLARISGGQPVCQRLESVGSDLSNQSVLVIRTTLYTHRVWGSALTGLRMQKSQVSSSGQRPRGSSHGFKSWGLLAARRSGATCLSLHFDPSYAASTRRTSLPIPAEWAFFGHKLRFNAPSRTTSPAFMRRECRINKRAFFVPIIW